MLQCDLINFLHSCRVALPAMEAFRPQLVLVSSGFDASYADPLGAQILSSQDFRCILDR